MKTFTHAYCGNCKKYEENIIFSAYWAINGIISTENVTLLNTRVYFVLLNLFKCTWYQLQLFKNWFKQVKFWISFKHFLGPK